MTSSICCDSSSSWVCIRIYKPRGRLNFRGRNTDELASRISSISHSFNTISPGFCIKTAVLKSCSSNQVAVLSVWDKGSILEEPCRHPKVEKSCMKITREKEVIERRQDVQPVKERFLQGPNGRFRDEMSETSDANLADFTNMAGEIGSAVLKVNSANGAPQNRGHSSRRAPQDENLHQSTTQHWQRSSSMSDPSAQNSVLDSTEDESGRDPSAQNSVLDSTEDESGRNITSEPSSSRSEIEPLREERGEQDISGRIDEGSSPSAMVLKKPTVSRPSFEKDVSAATEVPGTLSDTDDLPAGVGSLDLETGLKSLRRLIFRKHFDLAKELAKQLYARYPGDTDVLVEFAFVERQRGDLVASGALYSQAINAFEAQRNLGYDYVRALQALGSIEAHARNAKKARVLFMESIRAAKQAEQLFPGTVCGASVYGLHSWARLEEKLGNWAKARELLARAAEIQPGNAVVHQSRALLEAKAHNWGAARYHFSLATEAAPDDLKCWHAWAIFEGSQGKQQKMRTLFQRALEVDPNCVYCLQAWAHQETLIGTLDSKDKARSLLKRCVQIEPKSVYSWQAWAVMESLSGNYDKARELFGKCLEINPLSVACLQAFATMERNLGNWCSARTLLKKALRIEPENAAVLMEAGFVEKGLGDMKAAGELFVLAGMADKRKSRVRNKVFASRKEVMPHKGGFKLAKALGRTDPKKAKTQNDFKLAIEAIKAKQEELGRDKEDMDTDPRRPKTPDNLKHVMEAIEGEQKELEREKNVVTGKQRPSPHRTPGERGSRREIWVPRKSGA